MRYALGILVLSCKAAPSSERSSSTAPEAASGAPEPDRAPASLSAPAPASAPDPDVMRAADWEIARGAWTFEDGEARTAGSSSVMYWRAARPRDFDASVDVRFDDVESSAGLVFRELGDDFVRDASFYQYEWYTRGTHHDRRLSLMIKNPYWVQIVEPLTREPPLATWITLRVRAEGDRIQCFVGDENVFDKRDRTFARPGRLGLHVYQPRAVRFRGFRVRAL